jgi:hypothetical protein
LAADATLLLHVLFVAFVVVGVVLVLLGKARSWAWVRNPWFRVTHLLAMGVVVLEAWLGFVCPLTLLEMMLRSKAGDAVYVGSFITHWLNAILYFQAPPWVFTACYTVFAALVAGTWIWVSPRPFREPKSRVAEKP